MKRVLRMTGWIVLGVVVVMSVVAGVRYAGAVAAVDRFDRTPPVALGPVGAVAGGVLGCLAGAKLGRGIGTGPLLAEGNMEGRIACDDLPKKL